MDHVPLYMGGMRKTLFGAWIDKLGRF